jgi:choline-sulfatase
MDTVCDLSGVRAPKTSGRSLRPLLENRQVVWRESVGAEFQFDGRMLRTAQYKYVKVKSDPVEQLFDMQADPWEMKNICQDSRYATVLADHRRLLAEWESRLEPVVPTPDVFEEGEKALKRKKKARA